MEVDGNEENFLDDSEDTGSDEVEEEQQENQNQNQNQKRTKGGYSGTTNTVRLAPIPRGYAESHICDFIMSAVSNPPLSISLVFNPNKRLGDHGSPLYDAQVAFIVLASPEDAVSCSEKLHEQQFADQQCTVHLTAPSRKHDDTLRDETNWVKLTNLTNSTDEQQIMTHIQRYGDIGNKPNYIYLHFHDKKENYPGFAYIECANSDDATKCVMNLRNTELNGNKVWCSWRPIRKGMNRKQEELEGKTKRLVLANLHYTLQQDDISELCKEFGEVERVQLWYDKSGYGTGCASITMGSADDAKNVFEGLHDKKVKGLRLYTAFTELVRKRMPKKFMRGRGGRNRRGGKFRGRRDGVGGGRANNRNVGFAKKMGRGRRGGRRGGRGRSRGGPKFA